MPQPAILTHGLTKQFDRQLAVNDVDLQVEAGEIYGVIGPNGAGKNHPYTHVGYRRRTNGWRDLCER
ncbi:hypothetical protein [Leptothermofonsia sp. ETS-13]|uniref:hypothetical protein n=1 Tax=Leptothermofonsia sp. ETS-13 TaxID=3035696 RepID=UPI003BA0BDD1